MAMFIKTGMAEVWKGWEREEVGSAHSRGSWQNKGHLWSYLDV